VTAGALLADARILQKQLTVADTMHPSSSLSLANQNHGPTPSHRGPPSARTAALETIASEEFTSQDDRSLSCLVQNGVGLIGEQNS